MTIAALRRGGAPRDLFALLGFVAFSAAAMIGFGEYEPGCLVLVLLGIAASLRATTASADRDARRRWWRIAVVGSTALAAGDIGHLTGANGPAIAIAAAAAAIAVLASGPRIRAVGFALAAASIVTTTVQSWTWGRAPIDVFVFLQTATQRLLSGLNPYGAAIPQTPYTGYVGPAAIPFVYGPGAVLLDAPGRAVGDVRAVHAVAALLLVGCVLWLARHRKPFERWCIVALAALFPLLPPTLLFAWVDLLSMSLFALWLCLRRAHPWWAALALGVSLATKPSALVALLVMAVWLPRARRELVAGVIAAAVVVLPFVLITGVGAFWQDVAGNLAAQPPRLDSLTLDGFLHASSLPLLSGWLAAVIVAGATLLVLSRRPDGLSAALCAGAFVTAMALLVAKVAYLNYWFIPATLLLLALATGVDDAEPVALPWRRARQWPR